MSDRGHTLKLSRRLAKLSVTLISDTLDESYGGLHSNGYIMSSDIKPLLPTMKVAGLARTFRAAASTKIEEKPLPPLERLREATWIRAFESISMGDVVVYDTNRCRTSACWGEMSNYLAVARGGVGSAGWTHEGFCQDTTYETAIFSFRRGTIPKDEIGRTELIGFDVPVWCGGVQVNPGDLILGDADGVIRIPKEIGQDVIEKSEARLEFEDKLRAPIQKGEGLAEILDRLLGARPTPK